ncbi:hypothetical protein LZ554_004298 [Drepanopeziza brunnea f. sp. 'monogermtubi']|nr:hypothetical protein LZ554_004298 [Drepanopeziza brunnea f. sp. 'monogermtubi']
MSASSSAASSTLTRSRIAVVGIVAVAATTVALFCYRSSVHDSSQSSTLHRSNAVHRRRRRATTNENTPGLDGRDVLLDDAAQNNAEGQPVARALADGETVVDDTLFEDEYSWSNLPPTYQRNGQNIVQLLFRVSEDATRRNAYVHRGCGCNSCNMLPIRGIRYRCANCADYDLCEGCEAQGLHNKTHIFYKIRVPAFSFGPKHIQPVYYSGDPESVMRQLPREIAIRLSRETGFEKPELDAYWEQWTFMANTDWREDPYEIGLAMDRRTFEQCLVPTGGYRQSAPSLIFDRMFAFYDTNKDDLISFPEFLHGIAYRKKKDKWKRIFDSYDIDGDGYVDRKDFLRIFRSYYVLHRKIHGVMIETAEEAQMHSTEARRLISSRQPLSSAFGLDGRFPRAPDPRTGEGKTVRSGGDQEITDGKGIMTESSNDTGNREDLFKRDVPPSRRNRRTRPRTTSSAVYWEALVDPPQTVEQLPDVLATLQRELSRHRLREIRQEEPNVDIGSPAMSQLMEQPDTPEADVVEMDTDDSEDEWLKPESDYAWPPATITITAEDLEAIDGPGTTVESLRRESRRAVIQHALFRKQAQVEVRERWQRRHFYTDEEEGAEPPADWNEDDDILAQDDMVGESSKGPSSRPKIRSRSSSKVRFAEDMDDFDTRSNPSTSSRSVPERWGGIEIPGAERDAGKEILYQVTQQAFNELLDPLFKDREDLAIEAAKFRSARERWHLLYSTDEFNTWALAREAEDSKAKAESPRSIQAFTSNPMWPQFSEVEIEEIRERPLEDLLAASGYEVDSSLTDTQAAMSEAQVRAQAVRIVGEQLRAHVSEVTAASIRRQRRIAAGLPGSPDRSGSDPRRSIRNSAPSTEVESIVAEYDDEQGLSTAPSTTQSPPSQTTSPRSDAGTYRDPTLPQFRPDADASVSSMQDPEPGPASNLTPLGAADVSTRDGEFDAGGALQDSAPEARREAPKARRKPKREALFELWKLEKANTEAEERGGWGKLNFEEFERKVKGMVAEGKGSQMDYLGSWIEFCIP